ncbi:hypothetical protein [Thiorhodovibrio frisius]|uniref:Uncharacterized protein n=1 Tax=Thiorhodovibrio frisius TaxID=631362 RepID=H8Z181_9GAMM|nr:hypothetical protein [Thiorhodovibrio frisius]EIC21396.1 hypothetical protein Thi970DRAFT_01603 [Thiorhodovibrio frisius]WPL23982.1 hypothetical protein Thiofri_04191 [Thiorhodovibrio frisius]
MFDRLDAIQPISSTRFGQAMGSDENEHYPMLDGRAVPGKSGKRSDQRGSERRSAERRRKERRFKERRDDDRRGGLRMVTERRLEDRRDLDRRDTDRRRNERRLPSAPRVNLRGPAMFPSGWGRARSPVVDDYA